MLVKHLIRELQKCDPELPVETEGCDCYGDTYFVEQNESLVCIQRSDFIVRFPDKYDNTLDTPLPIAATEEE